MNSQTVCQSLHQAMESRNVEQLLSLYADDAALRVIDKNHPPSQPMELRGKQAIESYFRDVLGRDMRHKMLDEIISDDGFAFTEDCEYPDGTHVFISSTIRLKDGQIGQETDVQAWDEST